MKRIIALIAAIGLIFTLAACGGTAGTEKAPETTESQTAPETASETASETETASEPEETGSETETASETEVESEPLPESLNVGFLKGPTGIGAAYFMKQNREKALEIAYNVTLEADAANVLPSIIKGELDIAAVPTNAAAVLYNKTEGNVKILAINTLGVLHILENGETVQSVADLKGKTILATGQGANPEFVLNYILRANGLEPGTDVTVEFLPNDEIVAKMTAGEAEVCMLPVPLATTVLMKGENARDALDLNAEWEKVSTDGSILTQGCVVYRADKVTDAAAFSFLRDYEASINYMKDEANLDAAAELAVEFEIVGAVPVAKAALPQCGLTYVAGRDAMKGYLDGYFNVLFEADPTSVGGKLPDDGIYYEVDLNSEGA